MLKKRPANSMGLLGVDLDVDHVRLLQLREQVGDLRVVGAAMEQTPRTSDGQIDADALSQRIRSAIAAGCFAGRKCVVSVPRPALRVQAVRLPAMPHAEIRQAVMWEASQRFEIDRGAMEVDYVATGASLGSAAPAGNRAGDGASASVATQASVPAKTAAGPEAREELLLVAAEHRLYVPLLHALIDAGLRPVAAEPAFSALARVFSRRTRRESDRDTVRAVVEVGRTGSNVLILRGDQIAFCKPLEVDGRSFDKAAAEHLGIDLPAAMEIRAARLAEADLAAHAQHEYIPADPATDRAVYESARSLIRDLSREVTLCMRYYGVTFRGRPPECIILTGTDGLEPHIAHALHQSCKLPVRFDDPVATLASLAPQLRAALNRSPGSASGWIVAAGLSLRKAGARAHWDRRAAAGSRSSKRAAAWNAAKGGVAA